MIPTFRHHFIFAALILLLGFGCVGVSPPSTSTTEDGPGWVDRTLASLTLEEKAGQLVHVWTMLPYHAEDSEDWQALTRLIRDRKIGGLIASIGDAYAYPVQLNKLQAMAKVPLLVGADFEWGVGMRIRRSTTFPRSMAVGATRNPRYAYEVGRITAVEGRAIGIHQNYAPTVDVNNNPKNPVINTRAFGDDVRLVTDMGVAFAKGTQDGGMISTAKHFPGHGDTDVDTHLGLSTLNFSRTRLDTFELPPFREVIKAGVRSVMVGHLAVPAVDSTTQTPATVSLRLTTDLLQRELGFEGLIVTDAMVMHGVSTRYHPGEAVVKALQAGIDLVLMPVDADIAIDAIVAAVRRGALTEERIDRSVRKLLAAKQGAGLDRDRFVDVDKVASIINRREHQLMALEIARKAVTVLGNGTAVVPLSKVDTRRIADVVVTDEVDPDDGAQFDRHLKSRWDGPVDFMQLDPASNVTAHDSIVARASRADVIVVQLHLFTRSGAMSGFVEPKQAALVKRLANLRKPMIGVSFGNPYVAMDLPAFDAYVCGYSDGDVMQQAMAEVLFAEEPALGKLPVNIPGRYAYGDGLTYPKTTLRRAMPEEAGLSSERLRNVDAVMQQAVRDSAFPGGVVLALRNGYIIYHKAFGGLDYSIYPPAMQPNTIFDLASVTKVVSTTTAVMRLVDEKKIALNDKVTKFIPEFGQKGKGDITLYHLMVHNSGLPAWRKFYEFCDTPQQVRDSVYATPLAYRTGDSTLYSDLGLITMQAVVERASGTTLDRYVDSVFFKPLGMKTTMYNPPASLRDRIAPTEVDVTWKKTGVAVQGRVHDENAATLGGVSGHAGLFSTASDMAILMQMLLSGGTYGGTRYLEEPTVRQFTTRQADGSSRGIGWDTKTGERSFSGRLSSLRTFLHTGFTGTSVVGDPESGIAVILLTNRVHPTRANNKLGQVRPQVHNAIFEALVKENP
ncbi:MAG: serine hydrolase [Bacteroidetes bacterium]|jgi:beta-glucosidase-like glycosyl hydrolase/CubicO group peptidase (beta-lactamase class C family)|nr:serine hydrolase [Bacteroidota bacterium]